MILAVPRSAPVARRRPCSNSLSASPMSSHNQCAAVVGFLLFCHAAGFATDWPQYRGPTTDGVSPDPIATSWATNSPGFVVWTNMSLTNGFSTFAISQGRAFTMISRDVGSGRREYCAAVDAATGVELWAPP